LAIAKVNNNQILLDRLQSLSSIFNLESVNQLFHKLDSIIDTFKLEKPKVTLTEIDILIESINIERLKNHPVKLSRSDMKEIYIDSLM
jgi:hypothetical protein